MWHQLRPAFRMTLVLTVLTGVAYPVVLTALCQWLFPYRSGGSFVAVHGRRIGSELIGQNFTLPEYFHPRPSAAGSGGYDAAASGGSNLGPTSRELVERVKRTVEEFRRANPEYRGTVPSDLVSASASGLDPHISPAAAVAQSARVARARGMKSAEIRRFISENTESPSLGLLGEPRVNVLKLNLALDRYTGKAR